ncbi:two-component system, NarL family, sensor histidine kinase DegS [Gracilibacillus orientalis]|uniref:Signal transduction histidine-protein kinase/phosphatase DegS n=1 Tax=Gracilibacillus orientalis TaxID=334253 RepID=A0A1I4P9B2_9BACI|nr:sensor histidine kinase [Gracilibacillus orientalis]SFM23963.1 two-component system, NarL family, sensor histidine kinase DegS [Gracilibacillus orientalis]
MKSTDHTLDYIIDEMIDTVKNSKDEVFEIAEESRKEYETLEQELAVLKEDVATVIAEGDILEKKSNLSRKKLSEVSKNFKKHSEDKVKEVYDQAHQLQTKLVVTRDKEKALRLRRDEIELRLKTIEQMVERAEGLVGKISIVLNYLNEDFKEVSELISDAHEKQEFGLKIIEAQEEERSRLSREMHDGPAQMLANIMLRSEIVDRTYKKGDVDSAVQEMRNVRVMIRDSLYEVRRIIYDLRPMALDDLGLIPTIKKYISTLEDQHPNIRFKYQSTNERLHSHYEVALFRLIQESIQNAIKHAEAGLILVELDISCEKVVATITDNGKGIEQSEKKDKSFGIIGMHERVEILGGDLKINSSEEGTGTRVSITIPVEQENTTAN